MDGEREAKSNALRKTFCTARSVVGLRLAGWGLFTVFYLAAWGQSGCFWGSISVKVTQPLTGCGSMRWVLRYASAASLAKNFS